MSRPSRRAQRPPDDSWILEGDQEDTDEEWQDQASATESRTSMRNSGLRDAHSAKVQPRKSPQTRQHLQGKMRSEPQFVMPSMQESSPTATGSEMPEKSIKRPCISERSKKPPAASIKRIRRPPSSEVSDQDNAAYYASLLWSKILRPAFGFTFSVLSLVLGIVKPVLIIATALVIIFFLGQYLLTQTITRTLAPLCSIPGISALNLPFCTFGGASAASGPVEFDELMTVQSAFEDVLASSAGSVSLPLDMKRSEASIRDLKHVVQYSALPSRNELVFEFEGFIETARQASADLTRFNSRIGRAVDHVISTNRWTLQVIDGVAEREQSQGLVTRFIQGTVLAPFYSPRVTEMLLLEQYLRHTNAVEEHITKLILEAQALLSILQNLDDRLDVIAAITTRDGIRVKGSKDELLIDLWTWLGGNRSSLKKVNNELHLLGKLSAYKKRAWDHVAGTILKLQAIAAGLEDLRDRVSAPDVLANKLDQVPLRVHIERIQMGLDRLEEQRGESRRVEGAAHRKILDGEIQEGGTVLLYQA